MCIYYKQNSSLSVLLNLLLDLPFQCILTDGFFSIINLVFQYRPCFTETSYNKMYWKPHCYIILILTI